jgi:F-type H+-transporting ATPase subunit delta
MSVAKSYAKAFFETAKSTNVPVEPLEQELKQFVDAVEGLRDVSVALVAPVTSAREKVAVVEAITQKMGLSELTARFLALVARKERLGVIREILDAFVEVRLVAEGGVSGELVAAQPQSGADVDALSSAFSKKLGKKVAFRLETDPTLLAGVKVTVGGVTYDATLRSQLQRLRDQVAAGVEH